MTKDRIRHSIGRGRSVGLAAGLTVLSLGGALAQPATAPSGPGDVASRDAVRAVAPALDRYTQEVILGDLWRRPSLTPRERSIVTVSVLIARGQTIEMPEQFATALENGVEPRQLSEVITHLAFYAGHANAVAAALMARDVFARRGVTAAQLPPATSTLLPLDAAAEEQRRSAVEGQFGDGLAAPAALHDRRAVPRPLAAAGPGPARAQHGYRQRPHRGGPDGAADATSHQGDGQRADS